MAKHKSGLTVAFDPIKYTILAIGQLYPDLRATVHYMDEQFFQDNGILEWATAESGSGDIIFVNPFRTIDQIATAIAKGAVALRLVLMKLNLMKLLLNLPKSCLRLDRHTKI